MNYFSDKRNLFALLKTLSLQALCAIYIKNNTDLHSHISFSLSSSVVNIGVYMAMFSNMYTNERHRIMDKFACMRDTCAMDIRFTRCTIFVWLINLNTLKLIVVPQLLFFFALFHRKHIWPCQIVWNWLTKIFNSKVQWQFQKLSVPNYLKKHMYVYKKKCKILIFIIQK